MPQRLLSFMLAFHGRGPETVSLVMAAASRLLVDGKLYA